MFGAVVSIAAAISLLSACTGKKEAQAPTPAVPVLAATASRMDVPVEVRAVGNVEAYSVVSVKSRVAGEVIKVNFKEGEDVRKGELLFVIDPRPLKAQLRQAEANLAKDKIDLENAKEDVVRYKELLGRGIVAKRDYDQFKTTADALRETVKADSAAVENIRVQLGYTSIYSPIDGRTGNLNVDMGNIVKENDTPYMVVINQVTPIYVTFSVPEQYIPEIRKYSAQGKLKVEAYIQGDLGGPEEGELTFIDNQVDSTTGTIKLKGTFANREKRLWPGQFVDTALTLATRPGVTVVPSQAVQTGQSGQYVFVIKPDMTVEQRAVAVGSAYRELSVVDKGLSPAERVVTDGQLRLVQGTKVEIKAGLR